MNICVKFFLRRYMTDCEDSNEFSEYIQNTVSGANIKCKDCQICDGCENCYNCINSMSSLECTNCQGIADSYGCSDCINSRYLE